MLLKFCFLLSNNSFHFYDMVNLIQCRGEPLLFKYSFRFWTRFQQTWKANVPKMDDFISQPLLGNWHIQDLISVPRLLQPQKLFGKKQQVKSYSPHHNWLLWVKLLRVHWWNWIQQVFDLTKSLESNVVFFKYNIISWFINLANTIDTSSISR